MVLLLVASNSCDKLNRSYLPGKPDPFNNGEISDTILTSSAPFLHSQSKHGSSFSSDGSPKSYLPPRDTYNIPGYSSHNGQLPSDNRQFTEAPKSSNGKSGTTKEIYCISWINTTSSVGTLKLAV